MSSYIHTLMHDLYRHKDSHACLSTHIHACIHPYMYTYIIDMYAHSLYLDYWWMLYGTGANHATTCHCFAGKKTIENPYLGQLFSFFCWSTMVLSIYIQYIHLYKYYTIHTLNLFWKFWCSLHFLKVFLFRICSIKPAMCITPTTGLPTCNFIEELTMINHARDKISNKS